MQPPIPPQFAPQYTFEAPVNRGRVLVKKSDGTKETREVLVADAVGAWEFWAREMRFALENTKFVDIGGTVYRCETIDSVDPIRQASDDPTSQALQVALGVLAVIRDADGVSANDARGLCAEVLAGLEEQGFRLAEGLQPEVPSELRETP